MPVSHIEIETIFEDYLNVSPPKINFQRKFTLKIAVVLSPTARQCYGRRQTVNQLARNTNNDNSSVCVTVSKESTIASSFYHFIRIICISIYSPKVFTYFIGRRGFMVCVINLI